MLFKLQQIADRLELSLPAVGIQVQVCSYEDRSTRASTTGWDWSICLSWRVKRPE